MGKVLYRRKKWGKGGREVRIYENRDGKIDVKIEGRRKEGEGEDGDRKREMKEIGVDRWEMEERRCWRRREKGKRTKGLGKETKASLAQRQKVFFFYTVLFLFSWNSIQRNIHTVY